MKMWKNILQPDRQQKKICRMRIACWIPKVTDTQHLLLFHCNNVPRMRLHVTLYLHCLFFYSVPLVICHVPILLYSWDTKL